MNLTVLDRQLKFIGLNPTWGTFVLLKIFVHYQYRHVCENPDW